MEIPTHIQTAVNTLLVPYGVTLDKLLAGKVADRRLMDVKAATAYLGISKSTIYREIEAEKLKPIKLTGVKSSCTKILFEVSELDAWVESKRGEVR